jgi:hypothetical protein
VGLLPDGGNLLDQLTLKKPNKKHQILFAPFTVLMELKTQYMDLMPLSLLEENLTFSSQVSLPLGQ